MYSTVILFKKIAHNSVMLAYYLVWLFTDTVLKDESSIRFWIQRFSNKIRSLELVNFIEKCKNGLHFFKFPKITDVAKFFYPAKIVLFSK